MTERRVYIGWALTRPLELPLDVARLIVREVYRAGASARRALRLYMTKARIINHWLWEWLDPTVNLASNRYLMSQLTYHWLYMMGGREGWTPREIRRVERRRRRTTNPIRWRQWGIGSG